VDRESFSVPGEYLSNFFTVNFSAPGGTIPTIKIRSPKIPHRLVFVLDQIPGLPPQNNGIDNLFDITIPNHPQKIFNPDEWIRQMAQLQNNHYLPMYRDAGEQIDFNPTTLREITLSEQKKNGWLKLETTGDHRLVVHYDSRWTRFRDWLRSKLHLPRIIRLP
jgi:hypothetical protein